MGAIKPTLKKLALLLALAAVALAAWVFLIEPDRLVVRETVITLRNLPRPLDGLRVVALADLHAGSPHITLDKVRRVVELTNAQQPDLIVLLGDYVIQGVLGGQFIEPGLIAQELMYLRAKFGVYAVLGNHDWWYNAARVKASLENVRLTVLENDVAALSINGQKLWLAGLSDEWAGKPDLSGTLAKVTDQAPVIVLTHNPDLFPRLPANITLTLAGHTHGGQCTFPLIGRPIVPSKFGQRYAAGYLIENQKPLFVTSGLGTSILPVRFGVPPEIALLKLVSP
jgi:uncharacterized protein